MIVTLPAETVGVFCKTCRSMIGFSMYTVATVEVTEGMTVVPPRPLRVDVQGCPGDPAVMHPWLVRFVQRTDGKGGEERIG